MIVIRYKTKQRNLTNFFTTAFVSALFYWKSNGNKLNKKYNTRSTVHI